MPDNMKYLLPLLLFGIVVSIISCSRNSAPGIAEVDAAITKQFKNQWDLKKDKEDARYIKSVHLGKFYDPGSGHLYVEIEVEWNDVLSIASSPIVPLENLGSAISYEVPNTKQALDAIFSK